MKRKLSQEYLKECLTYNPDTGVFTWNTRPLSHFESTHRCNNWNSRWRGEQAGHVNSETGYRSIFISRERYKAHRLAFFYVEGYFPENQVDHINRIRDDNRWVNLREVSKMCNMQNCTLSKRNTSGVTGIVWDKRQEMWIAQISTAGNHKFIGRFCHFEDAVRARYQEEINNPLWTCSIDSSAYNYLKNNNLL